MMYSDDALHSGYMCKTRALDINHCSPTIPLVRPAAIAVPLNTFNEVSEPELGKILDNDNRP